MFVISVENKPFDDDLDKDNDEDGLGRTFSPIKLVDDDLDRDRDEEGRDDEGLGCRNDSRPINPRLGDPGIGETTTDRTSKKSDGKRSVYEIAD